MKQFYLNTSRIQLNQSLNACSNKSLHQNSFDKGHRKQNSKKYYKVLQSQENSLDKLSKMNNFQIQKFIKNLNSKNKFMYFDINEESGVKIMQKCEQEDDQSQQIGNNFIIDIHNLSQINNKNVNYLLQQKGMNQMKQQLKNVFKLELQKSKQKLKKRDRFLPNLLPQLPQKIQNKKLKIYRNMDINQVQKYKSLDEYQAINQSIYDKQTKLLQHYKSIQAKSPIKTNQYIKTIKNIQISNILPSISKKINTLS